MLSAVRRGGLVALVLAMAAVVLSAPAQAAGSRSHPERTLAPYQKALKNVVVPASCRHAKAHLNGFAKDWGTYAGSGRLLVGQAVRGHLAHHPGRVTVVPYSCNAGGVEWPRYVLVYGNRSRLIGSVDLARVGQPQEHEQPRRMTFVRGEVRFLMDAYEGAGFMKSVYRGFVGWRRGHVRWRHTPPLVISNTDYNGGSIDGPDQASFAVSPAPHDLAAFLQRRWAKEEANGPEEICGATAQVTLTKYSHRGFAEGGVGSCGGYDAIWAKTSGRWHEVLGMQDLPLCSRLTAIQRRAMTVLGDSCFRSNDVDSVRRLGHWPRSGM